MKKPIKRKSMLKSKWTALGAVEQGIGLCWSVVVLGGEHVCFAPNEKVARHIVRLHNKSIKEMNK